MIILMALRWVVTVALRLAIGLLEILAWSLGAIDRPQRTVRPPRY